MSKNKKLILIAAAAAVVLSCLIAGVYTANKKIRPMAEAVLSESGIDLNDSAIQLIAQGGLSGVSPENTYIAIDKAGREGFTAVQFDIRETRDGVWVLTRDERLDRMTNGRGKFSKKTYFELLNYTVDNGANIKQYPDTKIAELEDILDLCAMYGVRPYIGVEDSSDAGLEKLAAAFAARAQTQHFSLLSGDRKLLQAFSKLSPSTGIWYAAGRISQSKLEWLKENKGFGIVFDADKKANTDEKILLAVQSGVKTACRNTNDIETVLRISALGVNSFYTCCVLPK